MAKIKLENCHTRVASDRPVLDGWMFKAIHVRSSWCWTDPGSMAAGKEETAAALLNQSSGQPAQQEELAGIRVANIRVTEEQLPIFNLYI